MNNTNYRNKKDSNRDEDIQVDIETIFGDDPKKILEYMEKLTFQSDREKDKGKNKDDGVKMHQIRKIFDEIKIEDPNEKKIKNMVLKVMILLNYAKNRKTISKTFFKFMEKSLQYLMNNPTKENYEKFETFFEGLIAFNIKER